jgi:hypothetical protein
MNTCCHILSGSTTLVTILPIEVFVVKVKKAISNRKRLNVSAYPLNTSFFKVPLVKCNIMNKVGRIIIANADNVRIFPNSWKKIAVAGISNSQLKVVLC